MRFAMPFPNPPFVVTGDQEIVDRWSSKSEQVGGAAAYLSSASQRIMKLLYDNPRHVPVSHIPQRIVVFLGPHGHPTGFDDMGVYTITIPFSRVSEIDARIEFEIGILWAAVVQELPKSEFLKGVSQYLCQSVTDDDIYDDVKSMTWRKCNAEKISEYLKWLEYREPNALTRVYAMAHELRSNGSVITPEIFENIVDEQLMIGSTRRWEEFGFNCDALPVRWNLPVVNFDRTEEGRRSLGGRLFWKHATTTATGGPQPPDGWPDSMVDNDLYLQSPDGSKRAERWLRRIVKGVLKQLYAEPFHVPPQFRAIRIVIRPFDGVAHTTGDFHNKEIHFSTNYIASFHKNHGGEGEDCDGEDLETPSLAEGLGEEIDGVLWHEMVHCVQYSGKGIPGGMVEGIADWVRIRGGYGRDWERKPGRSWDGGYGTTAFFLIWIEDEYVNEQGGSGGQVPAWKSIVRTMNLKLRAQKWDVKWFDEITGKDVLALWSLYQQSLGNKKAKENAEFMELDEEGWPLANVTVELKNPNSECVKILLRHARDTFHLHPRSSPSGSRDADRALLARLIHHLSKGVQKQLYPTPLADHPLRRLRFIVRRMDGVAHVSGDYPNKELHVSEQYIEGFRHRHEHKGSAAADEEVSHEINGVLSHELVHAWQFNGNGTASGGLIEGISDYVRLKMGYGARHWKREAQKWDQGYDRTAYFLEWIDELALRQTREEDLDDDGRNISLVQRVNLALRYRDYHDQFVPQLLGLSHDGLRKLWWQYQDSERYRSSLNTPPERFEICIGDSDDDKVVLEAVWNDLTRSVPSAPVALTATRLPAVSGADETGNHSSRIGANYLQAMDAKVRNEIISTIPGFAFVETDRIRLCVHETSPIAYIARTEIDGKTTWILHISTLYLKYYAHPERIACDDDGSNISATERRLASEFEGIVVQLLATMHFTRAIGEAQAESAGVYVRVKMGMKSLLWTREWLRVRVLDGWDSVDDPTVLGSFFAWSRDRSGSEKVWGWLSCGATSESMKSEMADAWVMFAQDMRL
ncbi:peptidase of plants and bacteria-domain-containing protein [Cladochytrium replicatum]|nr:peptidase of plants and bacteria-domain-containing protein [Cladochytrium replicatum]